MRYLKKYISFNEEADFDPEVTDAPDTIMSKEKLKELSKNISDYKTKKSQIDQIYLNEKDPNQRKTKLESLLGPESSDKGERNPFLVEYMNVSDLKRRLEDVRKDQVDDKLKLDDFNQELKDATDNDQKTAIGQKISDISKRMGLYNTSISKLNSDIISGEKSLNDKMIKQEKELKEYIKNISLKKEK